MYWARIENDIIMETTDINPFGRYHPDLIWVVCDENTIEKVFLIRRG